MTSVLCNIAKLRGGGFKQMVDSLVDILCEWCLVEDAEGEDGLRRVEEVVDGDEGRLLEEGLWKQIWCQTVSDSVVAHQITSKIHRVAHVEVASTTTQGTHGPPCTGMLERWALGCLKLGVKVTS